MPGLNSDDSIRETESLLRSECNIGSRSFKIDLVRFPNGGFIGISEGIESRIGAISVCVKTNQGVTSTSLLPDRRSGIFAQMVGELIAEKTSGIAIISLYIKDEIDPVITKTLLSEVRTLTDKKD